jgi:hypothetical protein
VGFCNPFAKNRRIRNWIAHFVGRRGLRPGISRDGGWVADLAGPRLQKEAVRRDSALGSWEFVAPVGEFGEDEIGGVFGVEGDADGWGAIGECAGENFEALAGF